MSKQVRNLDIAIIGLLLVSILVSGYSLTYVTKVPGILDAIEKIEIPEIPEQEVLPSIRLGYVTMFTGSGAFFGVTAHAGAQIAVDRINKDGGLLMPEGRRRVELIAEDSKSLTAEAVSAAKKLIERDKVHVLLGSWMSSHTLAIMSIAEEKQIPLVMDDGTNWKLSAPEKVGGAFNEWCFHTIATDTMNAEACSKSIIEMYDAKTLAFLTQNNDWGIGGVESYKPLYEELGVTIVYEGLFEVTETEFYPHLLKIRETGADLIQMTAPMEGVALIMSQYAELGLDSEIFSISQITSRTIELTGEDIIGVWDIAKYNPELANPENEFLAKETMTRYGHLADDGYMFGFVAVNIAADAIQRAESTDPEKIREALEETSYSSPIGLIEYDKYHQAAPYIWFRQVQKIDEQLVSVLAETITTKQVDWDVEK